VLGLADPTRVETFLAARKDLSGVLKELKALGVNSLKEALDNIKRIGATAFSHTVQQRVHPSFCHTCLSYMALYPESSGSRQAHPMAKEPSEL
jgi:hypothetical protein